MNILYATNVRLPSERAHGHQIAQVCDALVHLGHEVTVTAPYRKNVVVEDYHTYYNAEPSISVVHQGRFDFIASPLFPSVLGLFAQNAVLRRKIWNMAGEFDLLYTRAVALLPPLLASGKPVILELHQLPRRNKSLFVRQCNRCARVACLTSAMRDELIVWGVHEEKLFVEGDAVDLRRFENLPSVESAREHFGLVTDRPVVGYIGRLKTLGMEKGVGIMIDAASQMDSRPHLFIVGGPEGDKEEYRIQARDRGLTDEDITFTGSIAAADVPKALQACDILAMPFPDFPHYRTHMSPLKMFEYMAAGKPILTSDLPTIRDVLSEETAFFCTAGSAESLAETLEEIVSNPFDAKQRSAAARELVQDFSWEKRMERILRTKESKD